MSFLRHYKWDIPITIVVAIAVALLSGPPKLWPFIILVTLEVSLSFDNAVVNAKVLKRMSPGWQRVFLTVGVLIAVVGMRFLFPIIIVSLTASIGFTDVISLAINQPDVYAAKLDAAHPEIAILGGVYLGMIFLNFFLSEHDAFWLGPIERKLQKVGHADTLSAFIMAFAILVISRVVGGDDGAKLLYTGVISLALFLLVQTIGSLFEDEDDEAEEEVEATKAAGAKKVVRGFWAGLTMFIYLEVQDAAFSFDGVSGAFAITSSVIVIVAGLGIGALVVRSITVHFVRTDQLAKFPYLENGAAWAIGVLSACILTSIFVSVPEWVTGLIGVTFISASVWSSWRLNRNADTEQPLEVVAPAEV